MAIGLLSYVNKYILRITWMKSKAPGPSVVPAANPYPIAAGQV